MKDNGVEMFAAGVTANPSRLALGRLQRIDEIARKSAHGEMNASEAAGRIAVLTDMLRDQVSPTLDAA